MIEGVFFDLGGTLYSYRNLPAAMTGVIRALAERLELEHDVPVLLRYYQAANQEVDRLYAGKPAYLFRDYFQAIFLNFLDRVGRRELHAHFDWFDALLRERLLACLELQRDCHATLDRLKALELYLSVVSNSDENQLQPLIERGELHRWLKHWTSSEAAQSCKPDARFFRVALDKSGLTADRVLFVGDSLEQDIQGAHAAGMRTVLITESDAPAPMAVGRKTPEPDFRITALSELPAIVEGLC